MRLSQKWVDKLVSIVTLPDAMAGFQTVDVVLKNGANVQGLMVRNCQDIMGEVYFSEDDIVDIVASNFGYFGPEA